MALMSKSVSRWFNLRGWIAAAIAAPVLVLVMISEPVIQRGTWLDLSIGILGWVSFLAGVATRFWATLYIGGRKGQLVVSDGPYSLCRNPLYVGSFFLASSAALFLESLTFAACIAFISVVYILSAVPAEERFLSEKYGEDFRRYCDQVPRYLPRWRLFRTPDSIEVKVKGLRNECRRAATWICLPVLAQIASHLRWESWWPRLLRLP